MVNPLWSALIKNCVVIFSEKNYEIKTYLSILPYFRKKNYIYTYIYIYIYILRSKYVGTLKYQTCFPSNGFSKVQILKLKYISWSYLPNQNTKL